MTTFHVGWRNAN